jgi:magnesium transporter
MTTKMVKKRSKKTGLAPGTLIHIGEERAAGVTINVIQFDETHYEEKQVQTLQNVLPSPDKPGVTWINIDGLQDVSIIETLGKHFNFHPLMLEDILSTDQRPKMEDFDDYLYIVLRMLYPDEKTGDFVNEQVSLIVGKNYVISFQEQEKKGDVFAPLRERIRTAKGKIRKLGPDYLAYSLIDAIVDGYFVIMEKIGDEIEFREEEVTTSPTPQTLRAIHHLKRQMILLRRSLWPLREVINGLERGGSKLIQSETMLYFKDVYDHTIHILDTIDSLRDMVTGMLDIYLTSLANRTNDVMKVLTIIATIFIPLTFIVGIYGMNFEFMPELKWRWGYFAVWGVMIIVTISMVMFFRRRRWI